MQTVIVLFNLKPGVSREACEAWARESDLPVVNALPSVDALNIKPNRPLSLVGQAQAAMK